MLKQLHIRNFALIDLLEVDFEQGFSVVTGETGAGKSIILGALGLLLGNRADSKVIKEGAQKCTVEAHFDISQYDMQSVFEQNDIDYCEDDCIIRREVNANGKSRAFVNDSPVSLSVVKQLGASLIDIHSQHQNLLLQNDDFQISVVDIIAKSKEALKDYAAAYNNYLSVTAQLKKTREEMAQASANADYIRFQYEELSEMHLQEGEDQRLEAQRDTMQHSEEIKTGLYEVANNMDMDGAGVITLLRRSLTALHSIGKYLTDSDEIISRLDEAYIELKDISSEVGSMLDKIDYDPNELECINDRLDRIYSLERKHHVDNVDALIHLREQFKQTLDSIEGSNDTIDELEKAAATALGQAKEKAEKLTLLRKSGAETLEQEIAECLKPLGLPNVRFKIAVSPTGLSHNGADRIEFLFSANPGMPLRPISETASGGEIARVMLSIKALISGAERLPTIIFDEIDTGVSGRVAEQMALMMKNMGQTDRQVISITHLPQIAAMGSCHYKVYKTQDETKTRTHMVRLTEEERVNEIAQMLSGSSITDAAIHNAKELLKR